MSNLIPTPNSTVEIRTLDRGEMGLTFRRRLTSDTKDINKQLETPTKAIPASKLYHENQISDSARGANEFYAEVGSDNLEAARREAQGIHLGNIERKTSWSRPDEFDFIFTEYTDAHRISRIEAYQIAGILSEYSDFLTVPRQKKVYSEIVAENGIEDRWYQKFRAGTELFLQACHELETQKPIMGAIPPLELDFLDDLINLYELYDVFAFYIDFDWNYHPAKPNQVGRMKHLMRRVRNQRIHNDVIFYALNTRRGDSNGDLGFKPAADFATATMGIDIVGGNHATPDWSEEVFEKIEKNAEVDVYCPDIMGYISSPVDRLPEHIPETSTLEVGKIVEEASGSETARRKYRKILNAEVQALDLLELRKALEEGTLESYFNDRHVAQELLDAAKTIREGFEEGAQSELDEWM